jgi:hypothetical protein
MNLGAALNVNVEPDVWTIATAVGTVGSVIVAVTASWYAVSSAKRERGRIEKERLDSEQETALREARKVVSICTTTYDPVNDTRLPVEVVRVINGSKDPILSVILESASGNDTRNSATIHRFEPEPAPVPTAAPVILSGQTHDFRGTWWATADASQKADAPQQYRSYAATIGWRDSSGNEWKRAGNDRPDPLPNTGSD